MDEAPQTATERQNAALLAWLNSLDVDIDRDAARDSVATWADPARLFRLCQSVDARHFATEDDLDTLADAQERLEVLQELYSLILDYFNGNLRTSTAGLPSIKLDSIAKSQDESETRTLLNLILAMSVVSPSKEQQVLKIQSLSQWVQAELMLSIKNIRSKMPSPDPSSDFESSSFAQRPSEDSLTGLAELQAAHRQLQESYNSLRKDHTILTDEHQDTLTALRESESRKAEPPVPDTKTEATLRLEIDRLQKELSRTESIIAESEKLTSRQSKDVEDLTKRVEELSLRADQADRLNDQVDEFKHASEKVRKLENVIEKYKKKLEDSAEARRMVRSLEEENMSLLEKHAALEEEHQKVVAYKPLVESYKVTIGDLESKISKLNQEKGDLQHQLQGKTERAETAERDLEAEKEAVALLEERLQELEQAGTSRREPIRQQRQNGGTNGSVEASSGHDVSEDDENDLSGIANELDDALTGRTTTDLKLQIRKLKRELQAAQANKADASKLVVLENLLEDSKRMKTRYEEQYLSERMEKLTLESQLEKIRSGKPGAADGADVAMALRIRLNETVEELDRLRSDHLKIEQDLRDLQASLHIARSDLSLVDKDQLEVLAQLRSSVATEKEGLEAELRASREEAAKLKDTASMQLSQINTLLLDKVTLQGDALHLRSQSLDKPNGGSLPPEALLQLESLRSEAAARQDQLEQTKEKLAKARQFIREQDRLFKEQHALRVGEASFGSEEESYKAQIEALQAALSKQQALNDDIEARYQKESRLMLSAWQEMGMQAAKSRVGQDDQPVGARPPPASWLAQQRARLPHRS